MYKVKTHRQYEHDKLELINTCMPGQYGKWFFTLAQAESLIEALKEAVAWCKESGDREWEVKP